MAIVTAPLLSFSATGTVADAITYSRRGGHDVVLKKPSHHTTPSAAQAVQRKKFQDSAHFYIFETIQPAARDAWRRLATYHWGAASGHNVAISAMTGAMTEIPDPSFAIEIATLDPPEVEWTMENVTSNDPGDEVGDFELWCGRSPGLLHFVEKVAIVGTKITSTRFADEEDNQFWVIKKTDRFRSGIFKAW